MDTLQSLFSIATATIFTLTAGLVRTFFWFPFHPYGSVVMTSRLLRTHHITTIALVAFSFLAFAVFPAAGTGFSGADALQQIWQTEKRHVELLYLALFVLGSTVLTIIGGGLFQILLVITKRNRQLFTDIYNVFVAFTLLWFVLLAALTAYVVGVTGASTWLDTMRLKIGLETILTNLGFSKETLSEFVVSPALWVMLGLSGYFGYLMLMRWSLRRGIRNIVRGKDAQKAVSRTVIMLSTAAVAFVFIIVPALYLSLLASSLLPKQRAAPRPDFVYLTACDISGNNKLHVTMIVKNNPESRFLRQPIFIDLDKADKAYELDPGDIFWMSKKGFYFDPSETRYYRLELTTPAMPASAKLIKCTTQHEKPSKGSVPVKAVGDSYSVTVSSYETK